MSDFITLCTAIVVSPADDPDSVLMLRRHREDGYDPYDGYWCLPGGSMEEGESAVSCAVRELFEETGLSGVLVPLGFTDQPRGRCRQIGLIYRCKPDWTVTLQNREVHRHSAIGWVDINNPPNPIMPGAAEVLGWLRKRG